jgi:hypothetical protein
MAAKKKTAKKSRSKKYVPNAHNLFEGSAAGARRALGAAVVATNDKDFAKAKASLKEAVTSLNNAIKGLVALEAKHRQESKEK